MHTNNLRLKISELIFKKLSSFKRNKKRRTWESLRENNSYEKSQKRNQPLVSWYVCMQFFLLVRIHVLTETLTISKAKTRMPEFIDRKCPNPSLMFVKKTT